MMSRAYFFFFFDVESVGRLFIRRQRITPIIRLLVHSLVRMVLRLNNYTQKRTESYPSGEMSR